MKISFDPAKREITLRERGIDFAVDAAKLFARKTVTTEDDRFDYGEPRYSTYGWLGDRVTLVIWTPRGDGRHIISMRFCHAKEAAKAIRFIGGMRALD